MRTSVFSNRHDRLRRLLIRAREAAGLTQEALGQKLSTHQQFVSRFETGERRLDVIEFLDIAEALGVDPAELIRELRRAPEEPTPP